MPKTLPQKLFLKDDNQILVLNSPANFLNELLTPLPFNTSIATEAGNGDYDIQIVFIRTKEELVSSLPAALAVLHRDTFLWFCYPKGGTKSSIPTNINRDSLWEIAVRYGLKAIHQISVDDTWSAVRFRIEDQ